MERWAFSDPHFGHRNVIKFTLPEDEGGGLMRPYASLEEMDEDIVKKHNELVKPGDIVYCLGDLAWNIDSLRILYRMNGDKHLILGNHDTLDFNEYSKHFKTVKAYSKMKYKTFGTKVLLSHIPIHPQQFHTRFSLNLHGHLHSTVLPDRRYINSCLDANGMAPIHLAAEIEDRKKHL